MVLCEALEVLATLDELEATEDGTVTVIVTSLDEPTSRWVEKSASVS